MGNSKVRPFGQPGADNSSVDRLVDQLVAEAQTAGERISGPAPASDADSAAELIQRVEGARGRSLFYPYVGNGVGRGAYVELVDGSVKLDLINGIGVHVLGHSHPRVMAAGVKGALQDVVMQGNLQPNREYLALSEKLLSLTGKQSRLRHVWLTTSGSMANENALKMCRQKTNGARKIIAMQSAFAGRTTMMAEVTDNPALKEGLPEYKEVLRLPFASTYSLSSCQTECQAGCRIAKEGESARQQLQEHIEKNRGDICCFTFEPMQGEGGYKVACQAYLEPLLKMCRDEGIPVWADEVQTFCRTGEFFAVDRLGIAEWVDVVTVAKTLQGAATLYTEELNPRPGLIAGTFSGSSSALAAGRAVLETLEDGYMGSGGRIAEIHQRFVAMLERLAAGPCQGQLSDPGGLGLMVAVTPLDGSREKMLALLKVLFKNGLMAFGCGRGPYRLRFLLPAVLTDADIDCAGEIIEKSLAEMA